MAKKKKYLTLYQKWIKSNRIDPMKGYLGVYNGMCNLFAEDELFDLFVPTVADEEVLMKEDLELSYWGYGGNYEDFAKDHIKVASEFTSLRQTIVLFMAAANGEL